LLIDRPICHEAKNIGLVAKIEVTENDFGLEEKLLASRLRHKVKVEAKPEGRGQCYKVEAKFSAWRPLALG